MERRPHSNPKAREHDGHREDSFGSCQLPLHSLHRQPLYGVHSFPADGMVHLYQWDQGMMTHYYRFRPLGCFSVIY